MRCKMQLACPLVVCLLMLVTSCMRAPKPVHSTSSPIEAAADVGIDSTPISEEGVNDSPSVTDGLATLHATQTSCVSCHEKKRPAPAHYGKTDCASCHSYPTFAKQKLFAHLPKPENCESCHARPATAGLRAYPNQGPPAGFDPNNKAAPGSGHYVGKDCASCHATPAEGSMAFTFTHSTPKADFCLPCHFNNGRTEHPNDPAVTLRDFGNCFSCHKNFDRNAVRNFGANGG